MTSHQLSATLKNSARQKLAGNYSNSALLTVTYSLINTAISFMVMMLVLFVASFIAVLIGDTQLGVGYSVSNYLVMLVSTVFIGVMNTGISLFFLKTACGQTAALSDLFYGYRYLFKKSLILSAAKVVVSCIPLIPYNICYYMFQTETTAELALATVGLFILGALISLPFSLVLDQAFYLLLDFPDYDAKKLLSLSIKLMKGRKWKLFYVQISFIPLKLLNILTFGIGTLWITPYMHMTMALFFLDTMKQKTAS